MKQAALFLAGLLRGSRGKELRAILLRNRTSVQQPMRSYILPVQYLDQVSKWILPLFISKMTAVPADTLTVALCKIQSQETQPSLPQIPDPQKLD